ncbi:MAG TPA: oligosaccharide flippase family protein [Croceibacterium sp.]|nr:oligosaccharide flippase family protein [Croceibacterium sp.]
MNERIGRAIAELRLRASDGNSKFPWLPASAVAVYGRLGVQAGWVVAPFGVAQVVRLVTNIVLARLLAPEFFGLMVIVNMLRTGTELLSDIGIGQSVVRAKRDPDQAFLDTAWTIQVARGALLTVVMLVLAAPLAHIYDPKLQPILLTVSSLFLIGGLQSPALFMMQRNLKLRQRATYDISCTIFQCGITIVLAYFLQSVWALVLGLLVSTTFSSALSYAFGGRRLPRFAWHRAHVHEIVHFGKWVFLATVIYFAASSTDQAFFGAVLPMTAVGIYGIARTFSDMVGQLTQRLGSFLVFPKISNLRGQHHAMADRVRQVRRHTLAPFALGMGVAMAGADAFILFCYDPRYHAAAFMLPVLLFGAWFGVLAIFAEALLLGCDRPAPAAYGNAGKFAVLAAGLPLAFSFAGLFGGLLVLALAECTRWLILGRALVREKLAFFGDDLALTALVIVTAIFAKLALGATGLVPDLAEWWAMGAGIHG